MTKSKNNENQMSIWKSNLLAKKAEQEEKERKLEKKLESGEMYKEMVSEAIGFITDKVTEDTKRSSTLQSAKNEIVSISIYSALIITSDLHLYTGSISVPRNPKTGKDYFFNPNRFKDEKQVKQFFEDVKAQLPGCVVFKERPAYPSDLAPEGSRIYEVEVVIDLNS